MKSQKQYAKQKCKGSKQTSVIEYSLDELLANSPGGAFSLNAQDKRWLGGSLVEKTAANSQYREE
jgi:hypothetical protein